MPSRSCISRRSRRASSGTSSRSTLERRASQPRECTYSSAERCFSTSSGRGGPKRVPRDTT
ncbi:MAG TPA: hypothetical protein VLQ93_03045 [Myxococcaceae bacterium]|nr:hypothetical protein [Myxococcaceae bacterium]